MRFNKGSKVEVLSRKEVPSGSWRCAQIIFGDGQNYAVRYDGDYGMSTDDVVETVSKNSIRPSPPSILVTDNWNPGDVVEVFDNFSWKMATIVKALGTKHVMVRLLGSCLEFKVREVEIRMRQSWQDGKWSLIKKGSRTRENVKNANKVIMSCKVWRSQAHKNATRKTGRNNGSFLGKEEECVPNTSLISSRTLKRKLCDSYPQGKTDAHASWKYHAIEKEGTSRRSMAENASTLFQQMDAILPRKTLEENHLQASSSDRASGTSGVDIARKRKITTINIKYDDSDDQTCSVGSCSITNNDSYMSCRQACGDGFEDFDRPIVDDTPIFPSIYLTGQKYAGHTHMHLVDDIHRLELQAYRCTIEALHASGPLSWEREALVTNLRLSLHISNDEHLIELRNLNSRNCVHAR